MVTPHAVRLLLLIACLAPIAPSRAEDAVPPANAGMAGAPPAPAAAPMESGHPVAAPIAAPAPEPAAPSPDRRFSVLGEIGWNGLAGLGPVVAWRVHPRFAVDAGAGLSGVGLKIGARFRWMPGAGRWTPLLGGGLMYGSGAMDETMDMEDVENGIIYAYRFKLKPSVFAQAVTGLEYAGPSGFTWLLTVGYARLLRDNLEIISGTPSALMYDAMRYAYGSGPVVATSFGVSF